MGAINIPFYVIKRNNRAYWQPQAALKRLGFECVPLGPDGPEAWAEAARLNEAAQRALDAERPGAPPKPKPKKQPAKPIVESPERIRFYVIKCNGRAYWQPSPPLRELGFRSMPLGRDGPEARAKAVRMNQEAERTLNEAENPVRRSDYMPGTLGDFFERYQRTEAWAAKEANSHKDYYRVWPVIDSMEVDGANIARKRLTQISTADSEGFHRQMHQRAENGECSESHRYRVLKVWRALLNAAESYQLIVKAPIGKVTNPQPAGRSGIFLASEIEDLQRGAEAAGRWGLALGIAIAYDTGLSPVDVRSITPGNVVGGGDERWVETHRKKTKRPQKHALSSETCQRLDAYLERAEAADIDLPQDEPLLRQPDGWRPYIKDRWERHFRLTRAEVMPGDTRVMLDIRRTANVEADIGGMSREDRAELLANNLHKSSFLEATYTPSTVVKSRQSLEKRQRARALLEADAKAQNCVPSLSERTRGAKFHLMEQIPSKMERQVIERNGASDGARTRDLRRDRPAL
jgi:integrase